MYILTAISIILTHFLDTYFSQIGTQDTFFTRSASRPIRESHTTALTMTKTDIFFLLTSFTSSLSPLPSLPPFLFPHGCPVVARASSISLWCGVSAVDASVRGICVRGRKGSEKGRQSAALCLVQYPVVTTTSLYYVIFATVVFPIFFGYFLIFSHSYTRDSSTPNVLLCLNVCGINYFILHS